MTSALGTRRLVLRPGTPVLARSPGIVQVGLDAPVVRLPDEPAVRSLLAGLLGSRGLPEKTAADPDVLDRLRAAGLLLVVPDGPAGVAEQVLRAQFGPDAVRRHTARPHGAAVAVDAPPGTAALLAPLLDAAGLRRAETAAVHLVVSTGPLDRERLDPLVRTGTPHLVVSGAAAGRRIGPFVEPGRTACLRCVDAHEALADVRRPLLLAQAATTAGTRPPPVDPVLDALVLAWAVRDLCRYLEGDAPSTWSATYDLGPRDAPVATPWGRHPDCGCAWDELTLLP
ncbi:hypothetical protein [Nocardioides sp. LML1-1-1.1]|uniref:hypothetical protein n=1 Tax=Nocardioides sp. LML1-1-1.1 TaxID=3135248 RepID=UPI0034332470